MDLISVFVIAFGAGCLTGVVAVLWSRHARRSDPDARGRTEAA
jgi:hypothetical protein